MSFQPNLSLIARCFILREMVLARVVSKIFLQSRNEGALYDVIYAGRRRVFQTRALSCRG